MSALIARVGTANMIKNTFFFIAAELAENIQIDSVLSLVIAIAIGPFATCLDLFFEKKKRIRTERICVFWNFRYFHKMTT